MIKRAAIYTRVSSSSQTSNYSLPTQQSACERYAAQHGFAVIASLSDEQSGATLDRPGLAQLRQLMMSSAIDAVIVYAVDRLTRNHAHALLLDDIMHSSGIELHIVVRREQADQSTGGPARPTSDATFAEYEHQTMQERVARGRRGKNEAGNITGQGGFAPYGYRMEGKKSATHLVVDEETAAIVRLIFTLFLQTSVRETSKRLQAMDVPSPIERGGYPKSIYKRRARTEWCDSSIYQILNNQTYIGQWYTYYTKIAVPVPAIVDPAVFAAAQEKLARGRAIHRRTSDRRYLLRRRFRCRDCNYAMIGCHRRELLYYRCTAANNGKHCSLPHIPARVLEPLVWTWITQKVLVASHLYALLQQHAAGEVTDHIQAEAERNFYLGQQVDLERRMLDLADLYSAGVYTLDETKRKKLELSRVHDSIVAELHTLTQRLASDARLRANIDHLLDVLQQMTQYPDESPSFEIQRQVVEWLDTRVEVYTQHDALWIAITCGLTGDTTDLLLDWQRRR
jgi:site-specific DNA recombinase